MLRDTPATPKTSDGRKGDTLRAVGPRDAHGEELLRSRSEHAVELVDLLQSGTPRVTAAYLVDTTEGPALVDCGAAPSVGALDAALQTRGLELKDIGHLLLTHVHLDHAGAAGTLVRRHPGLQVHVSHVGAPHLVDPSRLEASARRIFGSRFEDLWGELVPIPRANVHPVGERVLGIECFPSPGHASHHVCYFDAQRGTMYAGDAVGVRIQPSTVVIPGTPPPDVDTEAWEQSLVEIERRGPLHLAISHFGLADDCGRHLAELRFKLRHWTTLVSSGMGPSDFASAIRAELAAEQFDLWDQAAPFMDSYSGLERCLRKRRESLVSADITSLT